MEKTLLYHCKVCGYTNRIVVDYSHEQMLRQSADDSWTTRAYLNPSNIVLAWARIPCPNCKKTFGNKSYPVYLTANAIEGKFNPEHECNDECLTAVNAKCSCACGGANHGRVYSIIHYKSEIK